MFNFSERTSSSGIHMYMYLHGKFKVQAGDNISMKTWPCMAGIEPTTLHCSQNVTRHIFMFKPMLKKIMLVKHRTKIKCSESWPYMSGYVDRVDRERGGREPGVIELGLEL